MMLELFVPCGSFEASKGLQETTSVHILVFA